MVIIRPDSVLLLIRLPFTKVLPVKARLMAGNIPITGKARHSWGSRNNNAILFPDGISVQDSDFLLFPQLGQEYCIKWRFAVGFSCFTMMFSLVPVL